MTKQQTTGEFSHRLRQAIDGHPLAPPTPHGRQKWLRDKLELETGLNVSANTIHKWVNGTARPRPDSIRDLARVLKVDEVWLALGRTPTGTAKDSEAMATQASGAVLLLAGLVEMNGGRVTFLEDEVAQLSVNLAGKTFDAVVVTPQRGKDQEMPFIIPEPVGDARILAVLPVASGTCPASASACVEVIDLTDCQRQTLGGFSVLTVERRDSGKFKIGSDRKLRARLDSILEIAG